MRNSIEIKFCVGNYLEFIIYDKMGLIQII